MGSVDVLMTLSSRGAGEPAGYLIPRRIKLRRVSTLNLPELSSAVKRPDSEYSDTAEDYRLRLAQPAGSLGSLEQLSGWLAAVQERCPTAPITAPKVLVIAGDHGVAAAGVSAHPADGTAQLVRQVLAGSAPVNVLARRFGEVPVRVVDICLDLDPEELPQEVAKYRVRRGTGRIDREDACTVEEAEAAFAAGMALADEEADAGTDLVLLGDLGVGSTTVAAVLVAALCGTDASVVTGRGSGIDDYTWMHKCAAVRDALRRARPVLAEPMELLAVSAGPQFAALCGFLAQSAVRHTPVVLDGVVSAAAGLVVQRIAHRATDWWQAAQATGEPAQAKALDRMLLEPLMSQGVRVGGGAGAVLALPVLQAAAALLAELPAGPEPAGSADGPSAEDYDAT
jgi:nicotinate-nucleotide--dimethylbenzimidazole phosphoribosyltransferase